MTCNERVRMARKFVSMSLLYLLLGCFRIAGTNVSAKDASLDNWKRHAIADLPDRAMFILAADVDGDGRLDLIAGGWWWKNPGAVGGSWKRSAIGQPLRNMAIVYDFDSDGDLDIVSIGWYNTKVWIYENLLNKD